MGMVRGGLIALLAAGVGYALPGVWLARKTAQRQKQIQNGLPDALDLLIVCVEAGSGLDAGDCQGVRGARPGVSGARRGAAG